jgi:dihydrofolate synthase/folylpolyglutamate synthase
MDIVKPAPFVFTVAGTNGKGTTCRTLETVVPATVKTNGAGLTISICRATSLTRASPRSMVLLCRTLETVLMAAGYKVGVYSSPHLVRYTERVRIQGAELPPRP